MIKDRKWYLSWQLGAPEFSHDETIVAVGLRCAKSEVRLSDIISWLGAPDKVSGNKNAGHLVYFFDQQSESVAIFDVVDERIIRFGTITRSTNNAKMMDHTTGRERFFNILDTMEEFTGSELKKSTEQGPSPYTKPEAAE